MVITLSNLIVQTHINALGVDSIAAFTAYFKVENFIYLPIMAFVFCSFLRMSMISKANVTGLTAHTSDFYELTAALDIN